MTSTRQKEIRLHNYSLADPAGWEQYNHYHWYRIVHGFKLDYWPSTRTTMYLNKVVRWEKSKLKEFFIIIEKGKQQ